MAYSIDQDLEIMKEIERISQEPVNEGQYTAVRHGVKPIVESMAVFDDVTVDFNKWTSDSRKVNKAKTVDTGSAKPVTKNDTVEEKKEDGKVTEVTNVEMTKKKDQVVEVKQESDEDKAEPAPEVKNFEKKADAAAEDNRAKADREKHFAEVSKKQAKFKAFIESLVVDEASRKAADTVLACAEKEFRAQLEAIDWGDELKEACRNEGAEKKAKLKEFFAKLFTEVDLVKKHIMNDPKAVDNDDENSISIWVPSDKHVHSGFRGIKIVKRYAERTGEVLVCCEKPSPDGYGTKSSSESVKLENYDETDMKKIILTAARMWNK